MNLMKLKQPQSILDSMRGRINITKSLVGLGGIKNYEEKLLAVT